MKNAFTGLWHRFLIGYSFKTNNLPWLVNWMKEKGAWAEVVSTPEYELAKYVGFDKKHIIFNGPNKGYQSLLEALKDGAVVNLDNFEEIEFVKQNKSQFLNEIRIGLRINFDLEHYCPSETIPGKNPGRFGFNIENGDFDKAIDMLHEISNVKLVGLHGHHSTRTKSLKVFCTIAQQMCNQVSKLDDVEYLDLGGCLFGDKSGAPSFEEYAKTIVDVLDNNNISRDTTLIMEPGAALVASPFSYVCSVIGLKNIKSTRFVFTDGSKKHIAPQMNNIRFMSDNNASSESVLSRQVITGYTCVEMDRFIEINNSKELQVGDQLIIYNTGAYSLSLAPLFIEMFPKVVVKSNSGLKIVREAWSIQEFMQKNNLL